MIRAAVQMDPIERISIAGDSTFALMLEAQARGHRLFYYTPQNLKLRDGAAYAAGWDVTVADEPGRHYALGPARTTTLAEFDVVLLRQDPPFDMAYLTSAHLLERAGPKTLVVNDPASVRDAPEKLFVTQFAEFTPPTLVTRSLDDVKAFRAEFGDVVIKPLYGNGGAAVFHLRPHDTNAASLVELFQTVFREPFIVQKYLPAVRQGDKRIILVDGEPGGAVNRLPAPDETRSNLHVGGRAEKAALSARDLEICAAIGPELKRRGLVFAGIDVIGDHLTEINVTSPTGIREIKRLSGVDLAAKIWDAIEARLGNMK